MSPGEPPAARPYESYAGPQGGSPYGPGGPDGEPEYGAAGPEADGGRRGRRPRLLASLPVPSSLRSLGRPVPGRRGRDGAENGGPGTPGEPGAVSPAVYFVAAGVVLIVALIVGAGFVLLGDGGRESAGPAPGGATATGAVPSAYSMASSTKVFAPIAARSADARPLTAGEAFDPKTVSDKDAKASLKLTASRLNARCSDAVWGGRFAEALRRAGCTQASRAVYTDSRYDAMVTIFNLADAPGADRVLTAADPRDGRGFPQPPTGAVAFNQGFSIARGVAMGHYAVITWIRRVDGSGDETDAGLVSLLVAIGPPPAILTRVADHDGNG